MAEAGHLAVLLSLGASLWAVGAGLYAFARRRAGDASAEGAARSADRAIVAAFAMAAVATAALVALLDARDFTVAYVWSYTSTTLSRPYALSALWAGQEGSLLLWAVTLLGCGAAVVRQNRDRHRDLMPVVSAVVGATAAFFLALCAGPADPFARIWEKFPEAPVGFVPADGQGLNPMLQNPGMVIHPPLLYVGYVGFTIPFAFAIAALATGRIGPEWLRTTRRWSLASWLLLGLGILAGAKWAYVELGWGGYWAWDPVENASLMPWLTATAYIHSVMVEERRGQLRVWNVSLVALTFLLTLFGTFLTRSGVITSVHAFAQSGIGTWFAWFMAFWAAVSAYLIHLRRRDLASEHRIESVLSREAAFLANNLVLVAMAFAVMWGTVFPIVSEWATGERASVGPPYFNRVFVPLGLILFALTGVGPVIGWRRTEGRALLRLLAAPLAAAAASVVAAFALGGRGASPLALVACVGFVLAVSLIDFAAGARARAANAGEPLPVAGWRVLRRNGRRYGGYVVHAGMALILLGVVGAYYVDERQGFLLPGESLEIAGYEVRLESLREGDDGHRAFVRADVAVSHGGRSIGSMAPEISHFRGGPEGMQTSSEVDIRSGPVEDLYLVLAGVDRDASGRTGATIRAVLNPLVWWLWTGSGLMTLGAVLALLPAPRKSPAPAPEGDGARAGPPEPAAVRVTATALAVAALVAASPPADASPPPGYPPILEARAREVAAELICSCGCGMTLSACSHEVCGGRDDLYGRIFRLLSEGRTKDEILAALVAAKGKAVLGAPPAEGFDIAAWVAPFAALGGGAAALGALLVVWRRRGAAAQGAGRSAEALEPLAEADRRAVERELEALR